MEPQRADIVVAGIAIFVAAMSVLGARHLWVSARALRYGVACGSVPSNPVARTNRSC
jgi:exopolyphosphatase/pppGpp-phosphohydrolase